MTLILSNELICQISLDTFLDFMSHFRYTTIPFLPLEVWQRIVFYCQSLKDVYNLLNSHSDLKAFIKQRDSLHQQLLYQHIRVDGYNWRLKESEQLLLQLRTNFYKRPLQVFELVTDSKSLWNRTTVLHKNPKSGKPRTTIKRGVPGDIVMVLEDWETFEKLKPRMKGLCEFLVNFIPFYHSNVNHEQIVEHVMLNFPFENEI